VLGSRALPEEQPLLVIDLQGLVTERQTEARVMQEARDVPVREVRAVQPTEQPVARQSPQATPEVRPKEVVADDGERPAPAEVVKAAPVPPAPLPSETPRDRAAVGADRSQVAQTIAPEQELERERIAEYVKLLSKKVKAKLVYPKEGRRANERRKAGLLATATVAFTILADGQIRQESLRIVISSGQPVLDASALTAIRASVPFDPPPKVITVAIPVDFEKY